MPSRLTTALAAPWRQAAGWCCRFRHAWLARASQCLAARPVARIDVEAILLTGMREFAAQHNVRWATVLAADAADRNSGDWRNLSRVVDAGLAAVRAAIDASGPAVLLVNAGVSRRYDSPMLDELRDAVRTATAEFAAAHGVAARSLGRPGPAAHARQRRHPSDGHPVAAASAGMDPACTNRHAEGGAA